MVAQACQPVGRNVMNQRLTSNWFHPYSRGRLSPFEYRDFGGFKVSSDKACSLPNLWNAVLLKYRQISPDNRIKSTKSQSTWPMVMWTS